MFLSYFPGGIQSHSFRYFCRGWFFGVLSFAALTKIYFYLEKQTWAMSHLRELADTGLVACNHVLARTAGSHTGAVSANSPRRFKAALDRHISALISLLSSSRPQVQPHLPPNSAGGHLQPGGGGEEDDDPEEVAAALDDRELRELDRAVDELRRQRREEEEEEWRHRERRRRSVRVRKRNSSLSSSSYPDVLGEVRRRAASPFTPPVPPSGREGAHYRRRIRKRWWIRNVGRGF